MTCPNRYLLYTNRIILIQAVYNISILFSDNNIVENNTFQLFIDQ